MSNKYKVLFKSAVIFSLFISLNNFTKIFVNAAENNGYYYFNLTSDLSKKFYQALNKMDEEEIFKSGNGKYDLISNQILTESDVNDYSQGNPDILKEFGAAKDAFYLDHPEIFYVNFDLLSLSLGTQNGKNIAYIDAGRTNSYYVEGFTSVNDVNEAITFIKTINEKLTLNNSQSTKEKLKIINTFIIDNTEYGFTGEKGADSHIRSLYGFAKYGLTVCEGYAKTFKYYCNLNNIECEEVIGYYINNNSLEPHAWNVVKLENGVWYSIDCTFNDTTNDQEKYFLCGQETFNKDHLENGIISQSNFEFRYPTLAIYDYKKEPILTETTYDYDNKFLDMNISYLNKSCTKLAEDNSLYLVVRHGQYQNDNSLLWYNPYFIKKYSTDNDNFSKMSFNSNIQLIQFLVTDLSPNSEDGIYQSAITEKHIISKGNVIENNLYSTSTTPSFVREMTLTNLDTNQTFPNTGMLPVEHSYLVKIVYGEDLIIADKNKDIGLLVSINGENIDQYVKLENLQFDGTNTFTFRFTPSQMFQHNCANYSFTFINILTKRTNVPPKDASCAFERKKAICSKVFNDGRLYLDVYGNPTLVDNSDLSMQGWKYTDNNGNQHQVSENQRSQLALVVNKPLPNQEEKMQESISDNVLASETYELELDICGVIAQIPSGSYLKLSFGFPSGYSYNSLDEGVSFKVYHFKKVNNQIDYDNPEILDCVITEYGIIVSTDNFSPFMVVAEQTTSSNKTKSIYSRLINPYGKISTNNNKPIISVENDIEYSILPSENYQIDYLLLNGKDITSSIKNSKIKLNYNQLSSFNTLDVAFVHQKVSTYEKENGIENLNKSFNENQKITNEKNSTNISWILYPIIGVMIITPVIVGLFAYKKRKEKLA